MRNKILYFTGLAILTAVYAATPAAAPTAGSSSVLTFPTYGFRINSFETPTDGNVLGAVQMSWPAMPMPANKDLGFPPSVNVMIVSSDKGFGDYMDTERLNMKMNGFTIVSDDHSLDPQLNPNTGKPSNDNDWKLEYVALAGTTPMHWYAHAVFSKGRVYIATGGVPDEMWTRYGDKIKDCVNSLQATGTAVTSPLPAISLGSSTAPMPSNTPPTR